MSSLEQEVKDRYARVFKRSDWRLFKEIAEYYLRSAAFLKMGDIKHTPYQKLIRNIRKRLYIGIACELLLKALYLKRGYVINRPNRGAEIVADKPYKFSDVNLANFDKYSTLTLNLTLP